MYLIPFPSIQHQRMSWPWNWGVIQGHWKWRHTVDHIPLSTGRPLQVELYVVPLSRYLTLNNRDLQIWVIGHWRLFRLVPLESLGAVSYSPSIVTTAVSLTVYEISSVKVSRDLENGWGVVQGLWKWCCSIYYFLLVCHCKYGSILYCFQLFDVE